MSFVHCDIQTRSGVLSQTLGRYHNHCGALLDHLAILLSVRLALNLASLSTRAIVRANGVSNYINAPMYDVGDI